MNENTNPVHQPTPETSPRFGRSIRVAAVATAATLTATAFVGVGMAINASAAPSDSMQSAMSSSPTTTQCQVHKPKHDKKDLTAMQAWARRYGQDRDTMPMYPDVASATDAQRAAATALLQQTEADTSQYSDLSVASAAGYDLKTALAKAEQKFPYLAKSIAAVDAGTTPKHMPMLHVGNVNAKCFGILDPEHPQDLMYEYTGGGNWKLIGVMYTATAAFPNPPADPGGPITRWHYHPKHGGNRLMMHVFFVPGNDLAHAYATEMS